MAQFQNQASISYRGLTVNSNIVTGEVTQVLRMWKDATVNSYQTGDILTYVISIQNFGTTDFTNLTLTDDLGAYAFAGGTLVPLSFTGDSVYYYTNGILQTPPATVAGPPLVISGITVYAGLSTLLIYRVRVNEYAPLGAGGVIENTATLTGGGLTEPITSTETVSAALATSLSITKALSPTTVVENEQAVYTFTLQNTGATAATAAAGVVLADTFNPALASPVAVTLNGAPWAQAGNYTYDATTGAFATVAGRLTVPAASYAQDAVTGVWSATAGVTTVTVSGVM